MIEEKLDNLNVDKYIKNVNKSDIFLTVVFFIGGLLSYLLNDFLTTILKFVIELLILGITVISFVISGYFGYKIYKSVNK